MRCNALRSTTARARPGLQSWWPRSRPSLRAHLPSAGGPSPRGAHGDGSGREPLQHAEQPIALSCPECGGALREITDGELLRYRCHVGHAYDAELLLGAQTEVVEQALWSALRALEERAALLRRLAGQGTIGSSLATRWAELASEHDAQAQAVRSLLLEAGKPDLEP